MDQFSALVGLDFETFSDVDLRKHGLDRYVSSDNFKVLLAAVSVHDQASNTIRSTVIDFVTEDPVQALETLRDELRGCYIAAHNAGFEQAVLRKLGIVLPGRDFVDTAVLARASGFGSSLDAVAQQLLGLAKVDEGVHLIQKYCVPNEWHGAMFNAAVVENPWGDWLTFRRYCRVDAELSLTLARQLLREAGNSSEMDRAAITMDMNQVGWPVDMDLVRNMNTRYKNNVEEVVRNFRLACQEPELNLNSHTQLIAWCRERGVTARSFDEKNVASMLRRLDKRVEGMQLDDPRRSPLLQVRHLLLTKQILGGSSLKKLDTIENMVGHDGRLRNQYMHVGAGATFRTSGRGVQMQNLKRLHGEGDDVMELFEQGRRWSNDKLATNLRQVFTASDPKGLLIVGDFSSVESRGLAWQAGERWKLNAYAKGEDLYKVQASMMFDTAVDRITKDQRQVGKVGELACGYGAGPDAVREFAVNMGVELTQGEATKLVRDWRDANPGIVDYWSKLDDLLRQVLTDRLSHSITLPMGGVLSFTPFSAPASLRNQADDQRLLSLSIGFSAGGVYFARVIHGVKVKGRNVTYWKPSDRKTGDLWVDTFINPKTKQRQPYTLYGGKLSGLLTQSLCRELFFDSLRMTDDWVGPLDNVRLIGQFHDEIVLEWWPGYTGINAAKAHLEAHMSTCKLAGFPLAAEIKSAYRYIK